MFPLRFGGIEGWLINRQATALFRLANPHQRGELSSMTLRQSFSNVVVSFSICCVFVAGLTLVGCGSEKLPEMAPESRAAQQQAFEKGVDQSAKSKTGKKTGPPVSPKSVKGLIKKGP
jgi:hypothetical protein